MISRIDEGRLCLRTQNGLPCFGDRFRGGWIVDPVLEYWYENRNSPLSIRINDEIGPATIGLVQEASPSSFFCQASNARTMRRAKEGP